jgi:hypothetical protein
VLYRWGHRIGLDMKAVFPNFTSLALGLAERPSVKRTLAIEGVCLDGTK